ncbi:hypothetical protein BDN70DRAFT_444416 [Pholiota conissans]|uniref:Uncharacterized protein n=1 Tax=Pholiota conissans TaxID=109636 RepID=A0A9P6D3B8_9AGAR|nr:hypothetical protein BDN70DRAFT_444416 [Pholiota conissans]
MGSFDLAATVDDDDDILSCPYPLCGYHIAMVRDSGSASAPDHIGLDRMFVFGRRRTIISGLGLQVARVGRTGHGFFVSLDYIGRGDASYIASSRAKLLFERAESQKVYIFPPFCRSMGKAGWVVFLFLVSCFCFLFSGLYFYDFFFFLSFGSIHSSLSLSLLRPDTTTYLDILRYRPATMTIATTTTTTTTTAMQGGWHLRFACSTTTTTTPFGFPHPIFFSTEPKRLFSRALGSFSLTRSLTRVFFNVMVFYVISLPSPNIFLVICVIRTTSIFRFGMGWVSAFLSVCLSRPPPPPSPTLSIFSDTP